MRILSTVTVAAISNKDETVGALIIVGPERPNLVLVSDISHGETDVLASGHACMNVRW